MKDRAFHNGYPALHEIMRHPGDVFRGNTNQSDIDCLQFSNVRYHGDIPQGHRQLFIYPFRAPDNAGKHQFLIFLQGIGTGFAQLAKPNDGNTPALHTLPRHQE
jgi:hypothetical protein